MNHSFNVEVATKYGIPHALVLGHIDFMVQKARTNGEKRIDGKYWMRKSVGEFAEMYPYLTKNQVRRAIEKLRDDGLILSRRFKSNECTKTLWYTVTKEGKKILGEDKTRTAPEPQRSGTSAAPIGLESQTNAALPPYGVAQEPTRTAPEPQRSGTDAISSIEVLDSVLDTVLEEVVEGGGGSSNSLDNPFGEAAATASPTLDPLVAYAQANLMHLGPYNMDELISFRDVLPDEVIQHAIDEACAAGVRRYKYVKSILNRYVEQGFKSVAEVEAQEEQRKKDNKRRQDATSGEYAAPEDVFG